MIPYGRQSIDDDDIRAVDRVLRSAFLTQGPEGPLFESAVAKACGAKHAVAVNSATSALHIACLALELGPGDLLWTTPNSFVASANVALLCGAEVDFVDIDPATWNMCPVRLEEKLTKAASAGRLPKIVMPVHFAGEPCDMPVIGELAQRFGFLVIEDASHAIGASCSGAPNGRCDHSAITVFSFHPVKVVTSAEGGVATTQDPLLASAMQMYRTHGITRDDALMQGEIDGPWSYQQQLLGLNYRMTELQAALGRSQMAKLDRFIARRHELARRYEEAFAALPVLTQARSTRHHSALHLFPIVLGPATDTQQRAGLRKRTFVALRDAGIGVNVHYIPIHTQPYYRKLGFKHGDFPNAESYYAGAISLPLFPALTDAEQDFVIDQVRHSVADLAA
ncbi:MAG: UDP-4-amino-4,6-dideoxy-N-acetyl-beta-L-altrosamine transaminase [Pseudomonadota bacterium]